MLQDGFPEYTGLKGSSVGVLYERSRWEEAGHGRNERDNCLCKPERCPPYASSHQYPDPDVGATFSWKLKNELYLVVQQAEGRI